MRITLKTMLKADNVKWKKISCALSDSKNEYWLHERIA